MLAKENNENLYLLAIVGIVAVVGIVVMIFNNSSGSMGNSVDVSGQAISLPTKAVKGGKADLVITDISLREFVEEKPYAITIEYTIMNKGTKASGPFTLQIGGVYTLSDGSVGVLTGSQGTVNIVNVGAGKKFTSFVMYYPIDADVMNTLDAGGYQDFEVAGVVDVDNSITESDETNNWYTTTITVT